MSVQEYLEQIESSRKERFLSIHNRILTLYPQAELSMQYKMPTYRNGEGWVCLANQKNYISLYTCSAEHLVEFKKIHPKIKTGKGCINFKVKDTFEVHDLDSVIQSAMNFKH